MTRREPITRTDVEQAVSELIAAGAGAPTCRGVRDKLGGGSMTTISRLLREIEQDRSAPAAASVSLTPAQVVRATQAVEGLLGELRQQDRVEVERIRGDFEARVAAAERRAEDLAEAVDAEQRSCEEQLAQVVGQRDALARQVETATAERQALHDQLIAERALMAQAKAAAARLREEQVTLQGRVESLVAELAALESKLGSERDLLTSARSEIKELSLSKDELLGMLSREQQVRAQAEVKATRLDELETALQARTEEVGQLRAERDHALRRRSRKIVAADPVAS
jgi:chromosome segregation ATPase